jgi:3-oxoacyl-[acyl-carrier-protein] synthase II
MTPVAITGMGAVTPVGNDVAGTWAALVAGRSGVGPISTFDAGTFPVRIAGHVRDFDVRPWLPDRSAARHLSRAAGFGLAAAGQALREAGAMDAAYAPWERGVAMGGSVGRPELQDLADIARMRRDSGGTVLVRQQPSRVITQNQNTGTAMIARLAGCEGPVIGVSTACTASAHAIGEACRLIEDGEAKMMVAGGYDSLTTWLDVIGFSLLGALTTEYNDDPARGSRPFDRNRSGFVLGEGAVVVVLEDLASARERGATILAEITGYGSSLNAYRITDAPPDGGGTILAMEGALADSGLQREDVELVVAHGTGTIANDISETAAIKRVFGAHAGDLAVTAPKSMTGHMTAAAGGLGLLVAVQAMRHGVIPPTINLDTPDPRLDLDYVPGTARTAPVRAAMVNAFAFGGTNASLITRRTQEAAIR